MNITSHYSDITDWFFQTLQNYLRKQKTVTIALPGGHSLDGWYANILHDTRWQAIDKKALIW